MRRSPILDSDRSANATAVTDAFKDFAVAVDLTEFALRLVNVATRDHQLVQRQADSRPNAKRILGHERGTHEQTPFRSTGSAQYIDRIAGNQGAALNFLAFFDVYRVRGYCSRQFDHGIAGFIPPRAV
jgi:hypothetical protein